MREQRAWIAGAFLLLAMVAVWLYLRPAGIHERRAPPASLSTAYQPTALAVTNATVRAMPQSGVAMTTHDAIEQFDRTKRCYFARNHVNALRNAKNACESLRDFPNQPLGPAACLANLEQQLAQHDGAAWVAIQRDLRDCPNDPEFAQRFYQAAKTAAAQGDASAQACYLQSLFQSDGQDISYTPQDIRDYLRDAPRYISDGLARGDWKIVSLLAYDHVIDNYSMLPLVTHDDPYQRYVMTRVLQLGAKDDYVRQLDLLIGYSHARSVPSANSLTPARFAEGDREAQTVYARFFAHRPRLAAPPVVCTGTAP